MNLYIIKCYNKYFLHVYRILYYSTFKEDWLLSVSGTVAIFFLLVLTTIMLVLIFQATNSQVLIVLFGSVGPSVLLAIGFIPQIVEIYHLKSGDGYSTGLSLLDSTGK